MQHQAQVTTRGKVLDVIEGEPTYILLAHQATRPDGKQRTITQKIPVLDTTLRARLSAELSKGDEIEATVMTEWSKQGYSSYLSDFCKVRSKNSDDKITPSIAVKAS